MLARKCSFPTGTSCYTPCRGNTNPCARGYIPDIYGAEPQFSADFARARAQMSSAARKRGDHRVRSLAHPSGGNAAIGSGTNRVGHRVIPRQIFQWILLTSRAKLLEKRTARWRVTWSTTTTKGFVERGGLIERRDPFPTGEISADE